MPPYGSGCWNRWNFRKVRIPYQYTLEIAGIRENGEPGKIHGELEKLQSVMLDGEEMDVKAVWYFLPRI